MADKDKLRNMLDNLINDKSEQAQVDFHDYLGPKMKDTLGVALDNDVDVDAVENDNEE
jgi:hypothetical protein